MGHSRLGRLPATRRWKDVVRLLMGDAGVDQVALATAKASDRAFTHVQKDEGFKEAVHILTQLAVAATKDDPAAYLTTQGLRMPNTVSLAEVAASLAEAVDARLAATGRRSDFGEISERALVSAVSIYLQGKLQPSLFGSTEEDVRGALRGLRQKKEFGSLSRVFFAQLTNQCLSYFLSKTLSDHVGAGRRFPTTSQMEKFEDAVLSHCYGASLIVESFSADWVSKTKFEGDGDISRTKAEGFGWFAMEKMRKELAARARQDGD